MTTFSFFESCHGATKLEKELERATLSAEHKLPSINEIADLTLNGSITTYNRIVEDVTQEIRDAASNGINHIKFCFNQYPKCPSPGLPSYAERIDKALQLRGYDTDLITNDILIIEWGVSNE